MPIPREIRRQWYGADWEAVRQAVIRAAGGKCERCKKPQYAWIFTYTWKTRALEFNSPWQHHMIWIAEGCKVWRNQWGRPCSPLHARGLPRKMRVKLTVGHADHNPANRSWTNLHCWCSWCHFHHDAPHHKETRCVRKDAPRDILEVAS